LEEFFLDRIYIRGFRECANYGDITDMDITRRNKTQEARAERPSPDVLGREEKPMGKSESSVYRFT